MAFFEQIGKHLSDAGQNVAQQTKKLADVTQLNSTISEKQKKISQLYLAILDSLIMNGIRQRKIRRKRRRKLLRLMRSQQK